MIDNILVLQHIECEPLGIFEDILKRNKIMFSYLRLYKDAYKDIDINRYGGLIILGGPMNADEVEKYPFLGWELELIRSAQKRGLSILGICLGAQLIAKANGAKIKRGVAREIGWQRIGFSEEGLRDELFSVFGEELTVFQFHSDMFEIPKNAACLAGSTKCRNQALCIKDNVYGLQFHLEVNKEMLKDWLRVYSAELSIFEREHILNNLERNLKTLASKGALFFNKFLNL